MSKARNIVFVIVYIFGFKNCNVVLLDASTANIGSNSLAPAASIFTLSAYMGNVIVNSLRCRKILNIYINFLSLTENRVGCHVVFAWIYCTDVRIHCTDILIEYK